MEKTAFHIRETRLPDDEPAIVTLIAALLRFDQTIEPNTRTDASVAEEYFAVLATRLSERNGCSLFAEDENGRQLGWVAAHESEHDVYVIPDERIFGYVAELYVVEDARGRGIGRALIGACEQWARKRGLSTLLLGSLAGNERAFEIYRRSGYAPQATLLRKYLR